MGKFVVFFLSLISASICGAQDTLTLLIERVDGGYRPGMIQAVLTEPMQTGLDTTDGIVWVDGSPQPETVSINLAWTLSVPDSLGLRHGRLTRWTHINWTLMDTVTAVLSLSADTLQGRKLFIADTLYDGSVTVTPEMVVIDSAWRANR